MLSSLGIGQKISPGTLVVPTASLTELWGARSSSMNWEWNVQAGPPPTGRSGTLLIGASAPHCGLNENKRVSKVFPKIPEWGNQRSNPWTPFMRALLGTTDDAIIQVANKFIKRSGPCLPACFPIISMMTAWGNYSRSWTDAWLRASLQGALSWMRASRSRRHSQGYSPLWTCSPFMEPQARRPPNCQEKTLQQNDLIMEATFPIKGQE